MPKVEFKRLGAALRAFGKKARKSQVTACRKAAQRARTAVVETSKREGVRAAGTYDAGWQVDQIPGGAILGNSAQHARFVEKGRAPGRAPPREAIAKWMLAKGMIKAPPKVRKATLKSKSGQANRTRASLKRAAAMERYAQIAFLIQMKIKHRGFKGYGILKKTMPNIRRYLREEMIHAMRKVMRNPPKS